MNHNILLASCMIVLVSFFCLHQASATTSVNLGHLVTGSVYTTSPNLITIDLSPQCIALIKQNVTNDCPTYKYLASKYDNTNQMMSGRFITTNGFYHRAYPQTQLHFEMYPPSKKIIMVDADANAIIHSQEITIVPPPFTYIDKTEEITSKNNTRNIYHDRAVTLCKQAKITFSDYLLNDTIAYLQSGCTKTTFDNKSKVTLHVTNIDASGLESVKMQKYYAQIKAMNGQNCITKVCITPKDPDKKW